VSEHDIRALIRTVVNRGAHRQAVSFFADLNPMFNRARKRQPWRVLLIEGDPTELVDIFPLIPADYEAERSRILSPDELLELHDRFQQMTADYDALPAGQKYNGIRPLKKETQLALWISLGCAGLASCCRPNGKMSIWSGERGPSPLKTSTAPGVRNRTTISSSPPSP